MCFICAMRLRKLRQRGKISEADIAEVTTEIKAQITKAINAIANDTRKAQVIAVMMDGAEPNLQDFIKTTLGTKDKAGLSDELIAKMLEEYKYDPKKAN